MNEAFLQQVARYYYRLEGAKIAQLHFVFPSKRSLTFFRHYLSLEASDRPIFTPRMETIGDFIARLTPEVKTLDKTALIFDLYEAYKEVRAEQGLSCESLDNFLYWGGLILKDFDSCDRYLVQLHHLFGNLRDYKELTDDFSYLSEESRELIMSFWGEKIFPQQRREEPENESSQAAFLNFWESLYPLYEKFNERLLSKGVTYEGHLYRLASQAKEALLDHLPPEGVIFVGLFQLTRSEHQIFRTLHRAGRASFCWDTCVAILQDPKHPAAAYYQKLRSEFGSVPGPWEQTGHPTDYLPQSIQVIQAPSALAQIKGLPQIFSSLELGHGADLLRTALILPDEKLLLPVASSIPEAIEAVNITLGYPLDKTPIALLLRRWVNLLEFAKRKGKQTSYPADQLLGLLGHRLITEHSPEVEAVMALIRRSKRFFLSSTTLLSKHDDPLLELLLAPLEQSSELIDRLERLLRFFIGKLLPAPTDVAQTSVEAVEAPEGSAQDQQSFDLEFIHHYLRLLTRLRGLVEPYLHELGLGSVTRLMNGLVSTVTIPFEGNPLNGLQVMGLLESRTLHFETMIYLAAQEGVLPATRYTDTLIPFTLRRAFGLPVGGEDDLGADYTFFQSIAKARRLLFITSPSGEASSLGEESRYISLLHYVYGCPVERSVLRLQSKKRDFLSPTGKKEGPLWEAFKERYLIQPGEAPTGKSFLSPTRLSTYVSCPLHFYYASVCRLSEEDEPSLLLGSNDLGTITHAVMEGLYGEFLQAASSASGQAVGVVISEDMLTQLLSSQGKIRRAVETAYRQDQELPQGALSNLAQIYCQTIERYVRTLLQADLRYAPFTYIASEYRLVHAIPLSSGLSLRIGGTIDRIDEKQGEYRIVDYKTGDASLKAEQWDKLLDPKNKAPLQTLIYAKIYQETVLDKVPSARGLYPAIFRLVGDNGLIQKGEHYDPLIQLPSDSYPDSGEKSKEKKLAYGQVAEDFDRFLKHEIIDPLFDEGQPFEQTEDKNRCKFCPFALSCGRSLSH